MSLEKQIKNLLKPFDDYAIHINNIELAKLTFPYNTIPYDVDNEVWKLLAHPDFANNKYIVSSWGRIYNIVEDFYLTSSLCDKGYVRVSVERNLNHTCKNDYVAIRVHRLMGYVFFDKSEINETINHIDLNKTNNTINNLEHLSAIDNILHYHINKNVNKNHSALFTQSEINDIKLSHKYGTSIKTLAKYYGRDIRTISHLINNKTYQL